MGQQQLLLLIFVTVAVGTAVAVGIDLFSNAKTNMQHDALVAEGTRIITDIQMWKSKPSTFGGGSDTPGFYDVSFDDMGFSQHAALSAAQLSFHQTITGCFVLATSGVTVPPKGFLLGAYTNEVTCEPVGTLEGTLFSNADAVAVVTGLRADQIVWYTSQQYLTSGKTSP